MDGDPPTPNRVALHLSHDENRRRLARWFRAETGFEVLVDPDPTETAAASDACVVDLETLARHRDGLRRRKASERPSFYPVLLAHEGVDLDEAVWSVVDETITTPIDLPELRHRLSNLLQRRRLSRDLAGRLERTEERYAAIFEAANDAILIVDPSRDCVVRANPRAAELFGYSRSELASLSPSEDLHADDQDTYEAFVERIRREGRGWTDAITCSRKDGSTIEAEISASTVDADRSRIVVSIRDVTERREKARQVERQRDRLGELNRITRTLHDTTRAVVRASTREDLEETVCRGLATSETYRFAWVGGWDPDAERVSVRATGGDADAYLDRVEVAGEDARSWSGPTGQACRTARVVTVPDVATAAEAGPWRTALQAFDVRATAAVPVRDGDTVYGVLNLYTDRTHAFEGAEREVLDDMGRTVGQAISGIEAREQAQLFREAVDHAGNAMYITDPDGTIEYVNEAFEDTTGYAAAEAVGERPSLLSSGEHGEAFYRDLWSTILSGEVWESDIVNRRKDGRRQHIDQTIAPIFDDDGSIAHFIAVNTDVTERRRQQQQLQVLYRVLRHNLRNELNIVSGYTDVLRRADLDDESAAAVENIRSAAADLLQISQQSRDIAGTFDDEDVRMRPLSDVVSEAVRSAVEAVGTADLSSSIPSTRYRVDPELGTAVEELITNAIRHTDADEPSVELDVTVQSGDAASATVRVRDEGPGIPENERRVLRGGEETPLLHGSGLGLWLVNWVAGELGGHVDISDRDPRGTVVSVTVPLAE